MILIYALRRRFLIAIISSLGIFLLTPVIQLINTPLAFEIWFLDILTKPVNSLLYIIFSILFGMFISLYMYVKRDICIDCERVDIKASNANTGILGTVIGFIIGVCPACFSLIGVLLPLGVSITLSAYSSYFTLLSIAIILFSIFKLGGVKKMR
jgi:hypothetical protein